MGYLLMALSAGMAMAMQAAINSQLGKSLLNQPLNAALWSFASGTVLLLVLTLVKGNWWAAMSQIPTQPWWQLIGGLLGAGMVYSSIFLAPRLGVANMLFFIIVGQITFGLVIDQFGLFNMPVREISLTKVIGLLIMISGVFIFFSAKK